jgi:hypothetical protein
MAVRVVIDDDSRGGYINHVPRTFTRQNTDIGIHYAKIASGERSKPKWTSKCGLLRASRLNGHQQK